MSLFCSIGDVIGRLSAKSLQDEGHLADCHVNIVQLVDHKEFPDYQKELKYLVENSDRLDVIIELLKRIKTDGNTLVLVDRVTTGKELSTKLGTDAVFVSGQTKSKSRKEEYDQIATSENKIIIATYGVAAVGINIPRLFNIVLLEPGKSFVRVIQSIGRGLRKAHDKNHVEIYDLTSTCKFSKRHLTKRIAYYKEAGYPYSKEKIDWQ
jgi:superfamily II DNA or RNA helicase